MTLRPEEQGRQQLFVSTSKFPRENLRIRPRVVAHVLGVASRLADALSQCCDFGVPCSLPTAHLNVTEVAIQSRTQGAL